MGSSNNFQDKLKMTEDTLKVNEKKNTEKNLTREKHRIEDDVKRFIKEDNLNENKSNENFVDAYSTTSSRKLSKTKSLSLTNSSYSTKLLERLVESQNDNEFTRTTLAYQESSLKLLEEIKLEIAKLAPDNKKEDKEEENDYQNREVSELAKSIAELDIPSLMKEFKRTGLRMVDKTGMLSNIPMFFDAFKSIFADKSDLAANIRGKLKSGLLTKLFGKNTAQAIDKFEQDPMETIQDFINMGANTNNQFFRALFGKHSKGVEIRKPSDKRLDGTDYKALNDKLTYNTINYRLPETLDRIEAAITGNVKKSYDYASNKYLTDSERIEEYLRSGELFDIRSSSNNLLDDIKSSVEDLFYNGKISSNEIKQYFNYDTKNKNIKTDSKGRLITQDDEALDYLMLQIHRSGADLMMLASPNFNAEAFIRGNGIKVDDKIGKARLINAANTLSRLLQAIGFSEISGYNEDLTDNKNKASRSNTMKDVYSLMNDNQLAILKSYRNAEISLEDRDLLLSEYDSNKRNRFYGTSRLRGAFGGGGINEFADFKGPKTFKNQMTTSTTGEYVSANAKDRSKLYDSMYKNDSKNSLSSIDAAIKGISDNPKLKYLKKLNFLSGSNILSAEDLKSLGVDVTAEKFEFNDASKKLIDKQYILFSKATELYNKFVTAKMTPQYLAATTGQSYEYWVRKGYPTKPQDLHKYIKIDDEGNPVVDYDTLGKLNVEFNETFISSLEKRYKIESEGIDVDILDPGKSVNGALNELFKDPTAMRKMGLKSGSAAGFFLGKILQAKGVITSPLAPYLLGGVGAAVMNMESVQKRMNMILGPEGDLIGKSGFTNREIAMAKFMNKTLPRLGLGTAVAKNVYKIFSGTGFLGTGIGIASAGLLGLISGIMAPSLVKFGRDKLFGDDGDGNKGFLKGVGSLLRNVPWIDKYLAINIRKGDSDAQLISATLSEMETDVDNRLAELDELREASGGELDREDSLEYGSLNLLKSRIQKEKSNILKNPPIKKKDGESEEAYGERLKDAVLKRLTDKLDKTAKHKNNASLKEFSKNFKMKFNDKFKSKVDKREILRNMNGDMSDQDYDTDISSRNIDRELKYLDNDPDRKKIRSIFADLENEEGSDEYDKIAKRLYDVLDSDGEKKEKAKEFKRYMENLKASDADEALINTLSSSEVEMLKNGDIKGFMESISKDSDKLNVLRTLFEFGTLNEDYLTDSDVELINRISKIKARSLSNDPSKDKSLEERQRLIRNNILKRLNKRSIDDRIGDESRGIINSIRSLYGKVTGDMGTMDEEDHADEQELITYLRKTKLFESKEFLDLIAKDEESGSGSKLSKKSIKMSSLKSYKFDNGKTLDLFGCSIASFNNMLISMGDSPMRIEELISYANKHCNSDGSVRDTFFEEMARRLKLKLKKVLAKKSTIDKKFFKANKPSSKVGMIILKNNPNLNYGHFITVKKLTGNSVIVDDPERNGVIEYSITDINAISDIIYIFEKESVTIEEAVVTKIKDMVKNKTGIDLNKSLVDNVRNKLGLKSKSSSESSVRDMGLTDSDKSSDSVVSLLNKIYDFMTNGLINVRLVDDLMLPLKLSDGGMSRLVGDNRSKLKGSIGVSGFTSFYDRIRRSPVSKEEFEKADLVQEAIINGSGAGSSYALPMEPEDTESVISKNGGIGGIMGGLAGDIVGGIKDNALNIAGGISIGSFLKKKATSGLRFITKGAKNLFKKVLGKKGTEKAAQEVTEKVLSESGEKTAKFIPRIAKGMKTFFGKIFEKSPELLKRYTGKLVSTLSKFISKFTSLFSKFMKSSKGLIQKKLASNTAKGAAAKIPYVNIIVGTAVFLLSFASGYKEAPELLETNPDEVTMLTRIGVGFAKGVCIALPGFIIGALSGFAGAAFEIFMELYGFKLVLQWFLDSQNDKEDKSSEENLLTNNNAVKEAQENINSTNDADYQKKGKNNIENTPSYIENPELESDNSLAKKMTSKEEGSGDPDLQQTIKEVSKEKSANNEYTEAFKEADNAVKKAEIQAQSDVKYTTPTPVKPKTTTTTSTKSSEVDESSLQDTVNQMYKTSTSGSSSSSDILHPLGDRTRTITSAFGPRNIPNGSRFHKGIDIAGRLGDPVYSIKDGVVIYRNDGWGFVRIKHTDGSVSGYMHMDTTMVKTGQSVFKGQQIGTVGERGDYKRHKYRPHLHFEYQKSSKPNEDPFELNGKIDPIAALNLDPNAIQLVPKSRSKENIDYLNRNQNIANKLNDSKKTQFIAGGGKGVKPETDQTAKGDGPTVPGDNVQTNGLNLILSELSKNIKGLTSAKLTQPESSTAAFLGMSQQIGTLTTLVGDLIKIAATQSKQLDGVITALRGLKVDPSDMRAVDMSRMMGSSF